MVYAALFISILGLLFTVASFWWMNWRTGKLHVWPPRCYAASNSVNPRDPHGQLAIDLPLLYFNDGPKPIIINNLRLLITDEVGLRPLTFEAISEKIGKRENRQFATQFPIRGRETLLMICEFQRSADGFIFRTGTYHLELDAQIGMEKCWKRVAQFPLYVDEKSVPILNKGQHISYDNSPRA